MSAVGVNTVDGEFAPRRKVVPCRSCPARNGYPKNGLCPRCTLRRNASKHTLSPELLEEIRTAWTADVPRGRRKNVAVTLGEKYGIPWHVVRYHAKRMGLTHDRKPWSAADTAFLRANVGIIGIKGVANALKRDFCVTRAKALSLELVDRDWKGYSAKDVATLLAVAPKTIEGWRVAGWILQDITGAYTQGALERFLRNHLSAIDLRRVDQVWLQETLANMLRLAEEEVPTHHGNGAKEAMQRHAGRSLAC